MELTIHIDDSDIAPGHYLTGTLTLHLTAHYPKPLPPSPTHPTAYDNDPSLLYQHQLAQHYHHLLQTASSSPPQLQVTELLDRLQLSVLGKCLPDATKIPKDVLKAVRAHTADTHSMTMFHAAAVTVDRFDQPMAFDLLHQPYTCHQRNSHVTLAAQGRGLWLYQSINSCCLSAVFHCTCGGADSWSVLLPASLPPSYRGHSHRIGQVLLTSYQGPRSAHLELRACCAHAGCLHLQSNALYAQFTMCPLLLSVANNSC